MAKTFVTSDTHGCNAELIECLAKAGFDYEIDTLIHIGDCTDRGPDSYGVIETLLRVKNLIPIQGNHDAPILDFINTGYHGGWNNGAHKTIMSYFDSQGMIYPQYYVNQKMSGVSTNFSPKHIPDSHKVFFRNQMDYYVDAQNRLFVHGGYDPMEKIEEQSSRLLIWDRELVEHLGSFWEDDREIENYPDVNFFKRVFVGHTPTIIFKRKTAKLSPLWTPGGEVCREPLYLGQLVDIDTGCCFGNRLSVLDITDDDNHIVYQVESKMKK